MKKFKYLFWLVIIALVALVVYQNAGIFTAKHSLRINLYFFKRQTPELIAGVYYLAVFLIGMLISYIFSLSNKFRSRRTIRQLNEKIAAHKKKIAELEAAPAKAPQSAESRGPASAGRDGMAKTPAGEQENGQQQAPQTQAHEIVSEDRLAQRTEKETGGKAGE